RCHRVPDRSRRVSGRRLPLRPHGHDLLGRAGHRARAPAPAIRRAAAGRAAPLPRRRAGPGARPQGYPVRGPHPRDPRRTHELRPQARALVHGGGPEPRAAQAGARGRPRGAEVGRRRDLSPRRSRRGGGREPDISHSSVERVILPDSTILVDYMLHQMTRIIEGLQVYPERMRENMDRSFGLIYSQRVLLKLAEKGLPRQAAYELVQRSAMRAWRERTAFRDLLAADPEIMAKLAPAELEACFDPSWYLRNVDAVFRRAGLR